MTGAVYVHISLMTKSEHFFKLTFVSMCEILSYLKIKSDQLLFQVGFSRYSVYTVPVLLPTIVCTSPDMVGLV